ncbi:MAG: diversity-generating retroelement protein Avd [Anaerolineales bacterium]|nr:diversity-generating retroelement protein Avd [Anaerolineales bacterium]MCB8952457.1 diversity-generating retroelement protein Avd [Ardenticatenales bacterium]
MTSPKRPESPIFVRTYDWLRWLLPLTLDFPKSQRFLLAQRLQQKSLDFYDHLVAAGRRVDVDENLKQADVLLEQIRLNVRLCRDMKLMGPRQYEHAARLLDEIGRLLGGWLAKQKREKGSNVS